MLSNLKREGKIQGIKFGRLSPAISHWMFDSNIMLFFDANKVDVGNLVKCLNDYYN